MLDRDSIQILISPFQHMWSVRRTDGLSVRVPQPAASIPGDDTGWHLLQHRERPPALAGLDHHPAGVGLYAVRWKIW